MLRVVELEQPLLLLPLLLLLCVLLTPGPVLARFGPDSAVCDVAEYNQTANLRPGQAKPQLPAQWSVRVEVDMYDAGYSLDVHEYYDETNNRGAVEQWKQGVKLRYIYLYSTGELLVLRYQDTWSPPSCEVQTLQNATLRDYFGLTAGSNGSEVVYTPDRALHFLGSGPEVPMGRVHTQSGVPALAWETCSYIDDIDATLVVDWLFSVQSEWTSPENMTVPLERTASGIQHVNASFSTRMNRKYTYTDFRVLKDFSIFQTPPGTFCPNRVSLQDLPDVPDAFSFASETVDTHLHTVSWMKEYYDYDLKLVRWDTIADPSTPSEFGYNLLIWVSDYTTGVSYVLDSVVGNCSVVSASSTGAGVLKQDGSFTIPTKQEFFYLDGAQYQYTGQREVRGLTADVFIAVRSTLQSGRAVNATYEWSFAPESYGGSSVNKTQVPVRLHVSAPDSQIDKMVNVYDFSTVRPQIWNTDVSACFSSQHQHVFSIHFPATHVEDVISDINGFKLAFLQTAVAVTNITPLRVNRVEVEFPAGGMVVTGTLLDAPPPGVGDATQKLVSLQQAVNTLSIAVNQHSFVVVCPVGGATITATSIG